MKALLTKRSIITASVAVIIAFIAIISVNVFNTSGPVTGFANAVTRPVRVLASTVAQTFGNIFASIYRYEQLLNRYEELLQTLGELQLDYQESVKLAAENDRLRDLLEFRERYIGVVDEMATVRGWNSDNWTSSFIINRGYANSNIASGMPVSTEYGILIGQVTEVGATTSTVITVLDTTFSAAAFVGGTGTGDAEGTATVRGDFAYLHSGLLVLDHFDDELVVLSGTNIFTSGAGGVFPPNLTVGEVVGVYNHPSGIGRYATIRPMRNIDTTISTVFVIIEFQNHETD